MIIYPAPKNQNVYDKSKNTLSKILAGKDSNITSE